VTAQHRSGIAALDINANVLDKKRFSSGFAGGKIQDDAGGQVRRPGWAIWLPP